MKTMNKEERQEIVSRMMLDASVLQRLCSIDASDIAFARTLNRISTCTAKLMVCLENSALDQAEREGDIW